MTCFPWSYLRKIDKRVQNDDLLCLLQESVFGVYLFILAVFWALSGSLLWNWDVFTWSYVQFK